MDLKPLMPVVLIALLADAVLAQPETFLLVSSRNTNSVRMYDAETGEYIRDWAPNALTFGPKEATTRTEVSHPESINLNVEPNFPNPFRRQTTIPFSADIGGSMLVHVFDLQGRLVTSESRRVLPGRHRFHFDASDLAPGRYTYMIDVDGSSRTGSMIKQ